MMVEVCFLFFFLASSTTALLFMYFQFLDLKKVELQIVG